MLSDYVICMSLKCIQLWTNCKFSFEEKYRNPGKLWFGIKFDIVISNIYI